MSATDDLRTIKGKPVPSIPTGTAGALSLTSAASTSPTTFFLKSDRDMDQNVSRGRRESRTPTTAIAESWISGQGEKNEVQSQNESSVMADNSFGVQSLEETLSSTFGGSEAIDGSIEGGSVLPLAVKKRKAGNPVHPKILATGKRIISSDYGQAHSISPVSTRSPQSPGRSRIRRHSTAASSINLTPAGLSPQLGSSEADTPRSGSPKSVRLSDEDSGSVADDSGSQAVMSSSGEEDNEGNTAATAGDSKDSFMTQLVMPSIAMPARRPFTERGKRMGRLRAMVVGPSGVGKTSLIQSIFRSCEDVTHVDGVTNVFTNHPHYFSNAHRDSEGNRLFTQNLASTRPYPSWWTDFQSRRMLLRRKSVGEGALERNLNFIDTPPTTGKENVRHLERFFDGLMHKTVNLKSMNDDELIHVLSGAGSTQIDVVLWMFDPVAVTSAKSPAQILDDTQKELLVRFSKCTNVIPLLGRADTIEPEAIDHQKEQISEFLRLFNIETLSLVETKSTQRRADSSTIVVHPKEPFIVSSALADDSETIDASILMSSQYMQPLVSSELDYFVDKFLDPNNVSRMRHLSAVKFLLWRQGNLGSNLDLTRLHESPSAETNCSPARTIAESVLDDNQSKVLVPRVASSYFQSNRSISPFSGSDISALSAPNTKLAQSAYALGPSFNSENPPYGEIRLARWAQDLQRGLSSERRRYREMYGQPPSDWARDDDEMENMDEKALRLASHRPARGRLGGDLAVIDPRDPLGVLALSQTVTQRGWFALRIAGGCGLVAAVAFWVLRNGNELSWSWFGIGREGAGELVVAQTPALGAPAPRNGWIDLLGLRDFFGW